MSLPNIERAVIDPAKIRDYLLAAAHPVARFKARFFVSLGYTADQWERLRDDILAIALFREHRWRDSCKLWA